MPERLKAVLEVDSCNRMLTPLDVTYGARINPSTKW